MARMLASARPIYRPVIDLNGGTAGENATLAWEQGDGATVVCGSATLTAGKHRHITQMMVDVAGVVDLAEFLTVGATAISLSSSDAATVSVSGTSLLVAYDIGLRILTIQPTTGLITEAIAQAAIRSFAYNNTSDTISNGDRVLTVRAFTADGQGTARTATITVTAVPNIPPAIKLDGVLANYGITFAEGAGTTLTCPDATLADADGDGMASLELVISGFTADDEILKFGDETTEYPIGIDKTATVTANSQTLSVAYVDATDTITVTKQGGGTFSVATGQAFLRLIRYVNDSVPITGGVRTITITANDGTEDSNSAVLSVSVSGALPVITVPDPQLVAVGGAINLSLSATPSGLTWTAASLPTGASINSSTGAITGTLSTLGRWVTKVTASNASGSYDIWIPIVVYQTMVDIDSAWWTANQSLTGALLSANNTVYRLTEDIHADRTAFQFSANDVTATLFLNGFDIYYDEETPPAVTNPSFETGTGTTATGWDVTAADAATRVGPGLSFITRERAWSGDYSMKITYPCGDQTITNSSTVALAENTSYALTGHAQGNNISGTPLRSFQLTDGVRTYTTNTINGNNGGSGNMMLSTVFTVPAGGGGNYTLRCLVTNAASASAGQSFFDDIRVTLHRVHGVFLKDQSWVLGPGTIEQVGQTFESGCFNGRGADHAVIAAVTGTCRGHASKFVSRGVAGEAISHPNNLTMIDCDVYSESEMIHHRGNMHGYVVATTSGTFVHNRVHKSPQGGFAFLGNATLGYPLTVRYNSFTMQSRYTNGYGIWANGGLVSADISNNTVDTSGANDGGRGIDITNNVTVNYVAVHDNVINVKELCNNSEYTGASLRGCYGIQLEHANDVEVYNNHVTVTAYSANGANAEATGLAVFCDDTETVNVHDNTFIVDADGIDTPVAAYTIGGTNTHNCTFADNSSSSNHYFFYRYYDMTAAITLVREHVTRSGGAENPFEKLTTAASTALLTLQSPTFEDTTSEDWILDDLNWRRFGTDQTNATDPVVT